LHSRLQSLDAALAAADVCGRRAGRRFRGYQIEGVSWALEGSYLNSFSVGLGKTSTAICAAVALAYKLNCFVVPAHLFGVWLDEIARWTTINVVYQLLGNRRLRIERCYLDKRGEVVHRERVKELPESAWVLVAHETVAEWGRLIAAKREGGLVATDAEVEVALEMVSLLRQPELVVVDEVHSFGSSAAARTGGLHALCRGAKRVLGMSATLLSGGAHRLWGPLTAVSRGWGSYNSFIERYCGAVRDEWGVLQPGLPTYTGELRAKLEGLVLRYDARDFQHELPKETIQRLPVTVESRTAQAIGDGVLGLQKRLRAHGEARSEEPFLQGEVTKLRHMLASTKVQAVADLCRDLVAGGERVVVWCWHHAAVEAVVAELQRPARVLAYSAHGGCSDAHNEQALKSWQTSPGSVLVATTELLGTGVDVLARVCRLQVFIELPWRVDRWVQARGRLVRMSQTAPVQTYVAVADVPFERSLFDRLVSEAETTDPLLGDDRRSLIFAALGLETVTSERLNKWLEG
jgi:hypothetical protein